MLICIYTDITHWIQHIYSKGEEAWDSAFSSCILKLTLFGSCSFVEFLVQIKHTAKVFYCTLQHITFSYLDCTVVLCFLTCEAKSKVTLIEVTYTEKDFVHLHSVSWSRTISHILNSHCLTLLCQIHSLPEQNWMHGNKPIWGQIDY